MSLTQLHEKRGELVTQARAALDEITKNTDDSRTTELETRHDAIMGELDTLDASIKREERMAKIENAEAEFRASQRPTGQNGEARGQDDPGNEPSGEGAKEKRQAEYRDAFYALMREGMDTSMLEPEQRAILRRGEQELRTQVAGTAASGGYTVPVELAREIVRVMKDWGPMYDANIVREIVTGSGNEFDIPTNDDTAGTTSALAEATQPADDGSGDLVFGQKRLDAFVYATPFVKISLELMQDSVFDISGYVAEALGERMGRSANTRLTTGTGVGQPNGIVTASTLGKTTASATAIAADEVLDLLHSVNAAYRRSPKARFMFADTTLLAIRKLKDGQGNYLWQMGDIRAGEPDRILAHPYSINDDVPAIGTGNRAILWGDFSKYWVRKVGSPMIGRAVERFWPMVGIAGLLRFDGELVDGNAIKHLKLA